MTEMMEIRVWRNDFKEKETLLTWEDFELNAPLAIVFKETLGALYVSYSDKDTNDRFKL